ncbi:helix-turn-helix domain-containing protein [Rhodobacter capsulatus]|nr:helix-turn-helix transcriptional regulator [Rhodobacter capsulatus]
MTDVERPSELVHRLHRLRFEHGLTIQEMAEKCGLPKSSLESYMRLEGARRPGLDALVAIGDGMQVSLDWLVGRSAENFEPGASKKDYAIACFNVVSSLIRWMREEQVRRDAVIFGDDDVAGVPDAEVAAKSMLIFVDLTRRFATDGQRFSPDREALYDDLRAHPEREVGTK